MSTPAHSHAPAVVKTPFLAAAAFFLGVGALIGALSIRPLGVAELLGLHACVAAAAAFATIPFTLEFAHRHAAGRSAPGIAEHPLGLSTTDQEKLATDLAASLSATVEATVTAALEARLAAALPAFTAQLATALAAADDKRRDDILRAITATTPAPARPLDIDSMPAPAPGAKPRLGRGLLGLMHAPSAITPPPPKPAASDPTEERAAA